MTLSPALAEQHAAHIARMKRMGAYRHTPVVSIDRSAPISPSPKVLMATGDDERQRRSGGFAWTDEEVSILRAMAEKSLSTHAIAAKLDRSANSVRQKAKTLGVTVFRRPSREFVSRVREDDITRHYKLVVNQDRSSKIRIRGIIQICADRHGVNADGILADGRDAMTIIARHQAMWLAAKETSLSLAEIGRQFKRDHTTVIHSIRCENDRTGENVRGLGGRKKGVR